MYEEKTIQTLVVEKIYNGLIFPSVKQCKNNSGRVNKNILLPEHTK